MHDESNLAIFITDLPLLSINFEIRKNTQLPFKVSHKNETKALQILLYFTLVLRVRGHYLGYQQKKN